MERERTRQQAVNAINRNGLRTIIIGTGDTVRLRMPYLPNSADVEMGEPDDTGRRRPVVTDRTSRFECDHVLLALGQAALGLHLVDALGGHDERGGVGAVAEDLVGVVEGPPREDDEGEDEEDRGAGARIERDPAARREGGAVVVFEDFVGGSEQVLAAAENALRAATID